MDKFAVREGTREDCGELRRLIQELANFEKFPDEPRLSTEDLQRDGFDFQPPLFQFYVAESEENPGVLVGYIFYHYTYSTWYGRKMHLRDFYVTESYRKTGVGSALIRKLIEKAVGMDCWSIDFNVVGWNPARHFYFKFGAKDMTQDEGFRLFRMHWSEMQAFVSKN